MSYILIYSHSSDLRVCLICAGPPVAGTSLLPSSVCNGASAACSGRAHCVLPSPLTGVQCKRALWDPQGSLLQPKGYMQLPSHVPLLSIVILSYVDLQNGKEEKHKESLSLLGKNTISCIQGQNVRKEETLSSRSGHLLQSSP